jgi:hypothetical protein
VSLRGRFAREFRGATVELMRLIGEPELRQLQPVRAEAVCFEHLGASLHVRTMHVTHEIGRANVQLVIALVDEDSLRIQHRPHRAVEQDDGLGIEETL